MQTRIAIRVLSLTLLLLTSAGAAQAGSLTLAWNANTDGATAGYKIYWGPQSGVYTASVDVGNVTTRQLTGLADGAPYYFIVRAYNSARVESGPSMEVSRRVGVPYSVAGDFSGDFRADFAVFRPSNGTWYSRDWSSTGMGPVGLRDLPVPVDYDGDGQNRHRRLSASHWRRGTVGNLSARRTPWDWSNGGTVAICLCPETTTATASRPRSLSAIDREWYMRTRAFGERGHPVGELYDVPCPEDYDGDGKTDIAVFRPSKGHVVLAPL